MRWQLPLSCDVVCVGCGAFAGGGGDCGCMRMRYLWLRCMRKSMKLIGNCPYGGDVCVEVATHMIRTKCCVLPTTTAEWTAG